MPHKLPKVLLLPVSFESWLLRLLKRQIPQGRLPRAGFNLDGITSAVALWAIAMLSSMQSANAASGVWINTGTADIWSDTAAWSGSTVADGADSTADFNQVDVPATGSIVHLDTPRTIGNLIFGDIDPSTAGSWTLDNSGTAANVLTLQTTTGIPAITVNALGAGAVATISASLSGINGVQKQGIGTLALTGSNNYTGGTLINAGTLQINNAFSLGGLTGMATINSGTLEALNTISSSRSFQFGNANSTIQVDTGASYTISGIITDGASAGGLVKTGSGTLILSGSNTFSGNININAGILQAGFSNNFVNPVGGSLGNPQAVRNISVNNGGTLRFAAGDTFGGATTAVVSTLVINAGGTVTNNGSVFTTLGPVLLNGGTLTGSGGSGNAQFQMYSLLGAVTVGGTTASTISGSGNTTAEYHLGLSTTFNVADVTANSSPDLIVTGNFIDQTSSNGAASLIKTGAGTMLMSGSGSYTGTTTISAGTILLGSAFGIGNSVFDTTSAGTLSFGSITSLNLGGLTGGNNFVLTNTNGQAVDLTIGTGNVNSTYSGILSGTSNLTKSGTGILTLANAANTFGGVGKTINLNGGLLSIAGNGSLGNSANTLNFNGGGIQFATGAAFDITTARTLTYVGGSFAFDTNGNDIAFANSIGGGSAGGLIKAGSGILTLNGTNNYSGGTTITGGEIFMGNALALGGTKTGNLTVTSGTLDLNGNSLTFGSLTTGSTGLITSTGAGQIVLSSSSATSTTSAGSIVEGAATFSFIKAGAGTLTISNTSGFSGGVQIRSGTLLLGFAATTPSVNLISGTATPLTLGGATLQEANSTNVTQVQQFGGLTLASGASVIGQNGRTSNAHPGINLGAITHLVGSTIDFQPQTGSGGSQTDATTGIFTTTANGPSGILGGYATTNNIEWSRVNTSAGTNGGFHIYGGATYTNTPAPTNATNEDMTASVALNSGVTLGSLRFTTAAANTLTLNGSNVINTGGILVTGSVAANTSTINSTNTTDTLTSGTNELFVIQNDTTGNLAINANLVDNSSGPVALTKSGAGTVILGGTNAFTGGLYINNGVVQLASGAALNSSGTNAVNFGNNASNSSGTLRLNGNSATIFSLSSANVSVGTPVIEDANATPAILTVNGTASTTFNGTLQNGSSGTLGLTKAGSGTLTLSGTTPYTGNTTVSGGTLVFTTSTPLSGTTSVAAGTTLDVSAVSSGLVLAAGRSLTGSGTVNGLVALNATGSVSPGTTGVNNGIGTLTVGSISIATNSVMNFDFGSGANNNDLIKVTTPNGLTINGGTVNLFAATTPNAFATTGTFNLFAYSGSISGSGVSAFQSNQPGGFTYSFGTRTVSGTNFVTVTIAASAIPSSDWNVNGSGSWSVPSNWSNGLPDGAGNIANFGTGKTVAVNTPVTVTLDGNHTVGTLAFSNTNSYTIASGTGGAITLDGSSSAATITDALGNHTISAAIHLSSTNTNVTVSNASNTLTLSGVLDGISSLIKSGLGLLDLTGSNSYTGGTTIGTGTIRVNNAASLGDASGVAKIGAGTLEAQSTFATTRNFQLTDVASTIQVDNGSSYTVNGTISDGVTAGTLNKTGLGTLVLTSSNNYSGGIAVNAGTVNFNSINNFGTGAVSFNGGGLQWASGNTADISTRTVTINSNGATFDTNGNNVTLANAIGNSGAGALIITTGTGTLTLSAASTYTGGTILKTGTVTLNNGATLGSGAITFQGGTIRSNYSTSGRLALTSPVIAAGQTGTIIGSNRVSLDSPTGGGTLNLLSSSGGNSNGQAGGIAFVGSFSGFTGTLNIQSTGTSLNGVELWTNGGGFSNGSLANATINLTNNGRLGTFTASTGTPFTIGALSGDSTSVLAGSDLVGGGLSTYTVGGLNTSSTFAGLITAGGQGGNVALVKAGTGTLTLSGSSNYTGGTTINAGTLQITNAANLGDPTSVATLAGGTLQSLASFATSRIFSITGSSNIQIDSGIAYEIDGAINGATVGQLNKTGAGTLVLGGGAGTFTGETVIRAGTLVISNGTALANSILNYNNQGGTLVISSTAGMSLSLGGLRGSQNLALVNNTAAPLSALILGNTASSVTAIYNGVLSGTASVDKTGAYTQAFTGSNTYSGGTTIDGGTLQITNAASLGAVSGTAIINAGTLEALKTITTGRNFQLGGATATIQVDNGATYTISGSVRDNPSFVVGALNKTGAGTLVLAGNNSFTGIGGTLGTNVASGTLLLDYTTQNNNKIAVTTPLAFGGGTLYLRGNASSATAQTVGDINVNPGASRITLDKNGGTGVTFASGALNATANGATLDVQTIGSGNTLTTATAPDTTGNYGARVTFTTGTTIGNTDWATSVSAGPTFALSAYTGYTNLNTAGGTDTSNSILSGSAALASGLTTNSLKIVTTGTGQALDEGTSTLTLTNGGLLFTGSDDFAINNGTLSSALGSADLIVQQFGSGALTINSTLSDGIGGTTLTKAGPGTLVLTSSNTYTGATFLLSGTLSISVNNQLGDAPTGAAVNLNGGTLQATSTFLLANGSVTAGRRAIVLGGNGGTIDVTGSNNLTVSGVISQAVGGNGITKTNTGTLTLSGANTYTGPTNISGGTLVVQGSISSSSMTTVSNGGIIGGAGTIGALDIKNGGIVSPGTSPGTLTASNSATFESGGSYKLELRTQGVGTAGTDWDKLAVTGSLDLSGLSSGNQFVFTLQTLDANNVNNPLSAWDPNANHTWASVVTTTTGFTLPAGGFNSNLFTVDTAGFQDPISGSFSIVQDGTNLDLQYIAAVPEPQTWAMMISGAGMLLFLNRKRKRS
jgi:fibronectin-binding autotransporter adhesin